MAVSPERDNLQSVLQAALDEVSLRFHLFRRGSRNAVRALVQVIHDYKREAEAHLTRARRYKTQLDRSQTQARFLKTEGNRGKKQVRKLQSTLERTEEQARNAGTAAAANINALQGQVQADQHARMLAESANIALQSENRGLRIELRTEKVANASCIRTAQALQKKLKRRRRASNSQAVKVRKLRDKAKTSAHESSELEQKLQRAANAAAKDKAEKQHLSQQLADEKKRAEEAEKDSLDKDAAITAAEEQQIDSISKLTAESADLAGATERIGQLESEQKALQTGLDEAKSHLEQKVESARAEARQHAIAEKAAEADAKHTAEVAQIRLDHAATLQSELDSARDEARQDSEKAAKAADEKHAEDVAQLQREHKSQLEEANSRIERLKLEAWSTRCQNTWVHAELGPLEADRDYWKEAAQLAQEQIEQLRLGYQSELVTSQDRLDTAESDDEALESEPETIETEQGAVESALDEVDDRQQELGLALQTEDEVVPGFQEESEVDDVEHDGSVGLEDTHIDELEPETPQELDDEQDHSAKTADSTALDEELAKQEQADELRDAELDDDDDLSEYDSDEDGSDDEEDGAPPPPPSGNCDNDAQNDDSGYGDQAAPDACKRPRTRTRGKRGKRKTRARGNKGQPEWNETQAELFKRREDKRVAQQEAERHAAAAAQIQRQQTPQAQQDGLQGSRWAPATPRPPPQSSAAPRQRLGQHFQAPGGSRGGRGTGGLGRGRGGRGGGRW